MHPNYPLINLACSYGLLGKFGTPGLSPGRVGEMSWFYQMVQLCSMWKFVMDMCQIDASVFADPANSLCRVQMNPAALYFCSVSRVYAKVGGARLVSAALANKQEWLFNNVHVVK